MKDHRTGGIAVIGMACRYPDAGSPDELWENVLAGRRAFRRIPDERTPLADYFSPDPDAEDRFYAPNAALIEGYEFDRVKFRISGSTYRSTDLTHWLALDMAAAALADAGFPDGEGLPRRNTAVIVGNTLTGEFTRAHLMRLRWPYVRRTVAAALRGLGWTDEQTTVFLAGLEKTYKAPFPEVGADSLAGGLANTIAGRICNFFDLGGGGYTVDGACSSSLLSIAHACKALTDGDADIAIAGGVDLSLDPFELVGFAKTSALATDEMRVYDRRSGGFWPGEGCGMVVLAREEDAQALGRRTYARIAGWGISSDGRGGITRPEAAGQRLALERAYRRAGFGADTTGYIEGHGTGTAVGDATEIKALTETRHAANPGGPRAVLGTVKANIGHTKAAAGIAGLIKAVMAIDRQVIPPTTGCADPHPDLENAAVRVTGRPEAWPADRPIRAGVSSMGFGGINTHIVLEQTHERPPSEPSEPSGLPAEASRLARSAQDAELLTFVAATPEELCAELTTTARLVSRLSYANLADLATDLAGRAADPAGPTAGPMFRAAVVASDPATAERRLTKLAGLVEAGAHHLFNVEDGLFCGLARRAPRIVLVFPGQGSGRGRTDGALRRRFADVDEFYADLKVPLESTDPGADAVATALAQPRIAAASVAAVRVLDRLGVTAHAALGHSLGELTALHWAGVLDADALVRIAAERGRLMTETSDGRGAMAGIAATPEETEKLIGARPVVIAGLNAPRQTVVAGPADAVTAVIAEAETAGLRATRLPVSHAFHSPQVAPAARRFAEYLGGEDFRPAHRPIVSTVTAEPVAPDADVREMLRRQVTSPVRFAEAVEAACADADLVIEAGPGRVLSGLVREILPVPVVSMDSDGRSLEGVLRTAAACHVLGAPMRLAGLFEGRRVKPLPERIRLLVNPCETDTSEHAAPVATAPSGPAPVEIRSVATEARQHAVETSPGHREPEETEETDNVELVRRLAAEHAELPLDAVRPDSALLDELHLSSITVGRLVNDALRVRGLAPPENPLNFATATVQEIAQAMDELAENPEAKAPAESGEIAGVAPWIGSFVVDHVPAPRPDPAAKRREDDDWQLFAVPDHPLADPLRAALEARGAGGGVLVCLPPPGRPTDPALMLAGAQAALALDPPGRLVLLHHGADHGAAAMAKTLFLEDPRIDTLVVEAPPISEAIDWIVAEVAACSGFVEARYDETGHRSRPWLRAVADPPGDTGSSDALPLTADDVLLVTGGGKGITAECALSLAKDTGVRIAVLGRADPEHDTELAANLDRFSIFGVDFRYVRADVTDAAAVRAAVAEVRAELGPVTAVLHGAGRNVPRRLADLDEDELRSTLAPKVEGLGRLLEAVDPGELRLLVTFGSIIGRAGLAGEAHYAMANAALTEATVEFGRTHPDCRCLALEWSVWSGVGMGERLGAIESLQRGGITPISTDEGLAVLHKALRRPAPGTPEVLVVTGRLNGLPTVAVERRELPVLRFLDRVLVDYPGVELVTEAELSATSDPYLADHVLEGNLVFPAVAGLEAMAQVACAVTGQEVTGQEERPAFECVEFSRPIVVPSDGAVGIRVAALVRDGSTVEVVIRSAETGFHVDHFRATCRFGGRPPTAVVGASPELSPIRLDPQRDLYSRVLFQGDRFQRLLGYRRIGATYCAADIGTADGTREEPWFGRFLPTGLLLGDPGIRDAFMQAIQGSRPDQTLLPVGVDRIAPGPLGSQPSGRLELTGVERYREENAVVWDLTIRSGSGTVVEVWEGLRLQVVRAGSGPLPDALLGPYLERVLDDLSDGRDLRIAVESATGSADRGERTTLALGRMLGRDVVVRHRPDGRPEVPGADQVSVAHDTDLTVTVTGAGVTCDVEQVAARPDEDWQDLLGADRYALAERLVAEYGDDLAAAATRVWCAAECGQKAGRGSVEPLTDAGRAASDGWVLLRAGEAEVATYVTTRWERDERIALAFRYPVSAQRESRGAA